MMLVDADGDIIGTPAPTHFMPSATSGRWIPVSWLSDEARGKVLPFLGRECGTGDTVVMVTNMPGRVMVTRVKSLLPLAVAREAGVAARDEVSDEALKAAAAAAESEFGSGASGSRRYVDVAKREDGVGANKQHGPNDPGDTFSGGFHDAFSSGAFERVGFKNRERSVGAVTPPPGSRSRSYDTADGGRLDVRRRIGATQCSAQWR